MRKEKDEKRTPEKEISKKTRQSEVSETWAEETIADLDDFIESQGDLYQTVGHIVRWEDI